MQNKPDFARAYSKANEILATSPEIPTFPFSPKALINAQPSITCRSYKKALKYGVDITAFGSESAVIMKMNDKSIIFYDSAKPIAHINFSLTHEWGTL